MSDYYNKFDKGRNVNFRRYSPWEPRNEGHRKTDSGYDRHYDNRGSPRYYRSYLYQDKYKESHLKRPLDVHEPDHRRFICHRDCNYRSTNHSSQNRFYQKNPPRKEIFRSINDNEYNYRKYYASTFNNNNWNFPNISNETKFNYNQFPEEWHYMVYLTLENMKQYHAQLVSWNNVRDSSFYQSRNNPSSRRYTTNQHGRRRERSHINIRKQKKFHNFKRNSYAHFKHFAKFDRKGKADKVLPTKQNSGNWDSTIELHDLAKPGLFHDFAPSISSTPIKKKIYLAYKKVAENNSTVFLY